MKIDFIISRLQGGGAERVLSLLASNLAKRKKYNVSVITFNKGVDVYSLDESIQRVSLDFGMIPNHKIRSFINLWKYYSIKRNRPDLIISFLTLNNLITIPIAKFYSIKIIVEEHTSYLRFIKGRKFLSDLTKNFLYKKADVLTVLTSFDVAFYKKHGANVMVMPNPCSFNPIKENNSNRQKLILAVGSLDRYHIKGFDNLIELISPILKTNPEWKLKIAGSGIGNEGHKLLIELTEKFKISNQVIFTGFVSNISEIMYESSIFILSSRFEGLPMVLLEAMSQGMACISFDCKTGPSDIITNDVNGLLIEDQNKKEMQINLQKLMESNSLRNRLSIEALVSLDNYNIKSVISRYEKIFEFLITEK